MFDQYKALIFDMDGTLVDSGQLHEAAWSATLNRYGLPIDRAFMRSLVGVPAVGTMLEIMKHFNCRASASLDEMNQFKDAYIKQHLHQFVKPTSLIDVVRQYAGVIPMSVGTGSGTIEAETVLRACGLHDFMDHIVGFDQVSHAKPAPDTFLLCASLMAVAPSDCIVFEDGKLGMTAAESAGMAVVDVLETFSITNDYFL